jgi:transcription antitermination protein NusB
MANRHLSRSVALQTLFEWDFRGGKSFDLTTSIEHNLKEFAPGLEEDTFVYTLLETVLDKHSLIDEIIKKAAPEWPLEKISIVDRNVLRIGLTELLFGDRKQVPPKVAINEAIELAKTFGGENSGKFVNGVLGAVYKEIGEPGKDEVSKKKMRDGTIDKSKLPVEYFGGAIIFARDGNNLYFALVHDVFGYWTLSKGHIENGEDKKESTKKRIKEEIGLEISLQEELGENEYVASHPQKGKILKKVTYFLAESEHRELVLGPSGGLDEARWFSLSEIPELRIYGDIVTLISKAIEIISNKKP